jgi:hypothetical protein
VHPADGRRRPEVEFVADHLKVKVGAAPNTNLTLQGLSHARGSTPDGVGEPSVDSTDPGWRIRDWAESGRP